MSNINPVRVEVVSGNQTNILRSYTRRADGTPLPSGSTAEDYVQISFETSSQGVGSWQTFAWRNGDAAVTVSLPQNAMVDGGEGEVGVWEPAIDGVEGFNVKLEMPAIIILSPLPNSVIDWNFTVGIGFYKITVPWVFGSERVVQEFAVSVRE